MNSRIFIAVFATFLTCLIPVVFSVHYLSTSEFAENGQLEFSVLLYKTIANSESGNFAVSTINVFVDLLRLYYGSLPPTRPILATILGVSRTVSPETAYEFLLRKVEGGPWKEDLPLKRVYQMPCTYREAFYVNPSLSIKDVEYTQLLVKVTHGDLPDIEARYIELNWDEEPSNVTTYIIFPNGQTNLNLVEKNITSRTIRTMIDNTNKEYIQLSLPEISFDSKLFLKDVLEEMKVSNVFSGETDFSELAEPPPEHIDDVVNVVTVRGFPTNGTVPECDGGRQPILTAHPPFPNFKLNRGVIMVLVLKGDPAHQINPVVLGMARYQHPAL